MKLTAVYHSGTRYDITSGAHRVVTDQPIEDGGQDAGMSPVELFVGSLAVVWDISWVATATAIRFRPKG